MTFTVEGDVVEKKLDEWLQVRVKETTVISEGQQGVLEEVLV